MHLALVYPEPLPSLKARAGSMAHTAESLSAWAEVTVLTERRSSLSATHEYFDIRGTWRMARLPRRLLGRVSNAWFHWHLRSWLHHAKPDGLYVRHPKTAHALLRRPHPFPIVYEVHELFHCNASGTDAQRLRAMESEIFERADGLVFINDALRTACEEHFGPLRVPYLIAPLGAKRPLTPPQKSWDGAQVVTYAGSFDAWKGVDTLVAAMAQVPGVTLQLIGPIAPERREQLLAQAGSARERVRFTPAMPQHALREHLIHRATLAVLPNHEGPYARFSTPLKLLEYWAAGCAVVASAIPTVVELVGNRGAAHLVAPGDPEALAAALRTLAHDPATARALGQAGFDHSAHFTWEARAKKLVDFFTTLRKAP